MFVSQRSPVKPGGQEHRKLFPRSVQVAPFEHGFGEHWSSWDSQSFPV